MLEKADVTPATTKENVATPSPAKEAQKAEMVLNSRQVRRYPGPHPCCAQILAPLAFESQPATSQPYDLGHVALPLWASVSPLVRAPMWWGCLEG